MAPQFDFSFISHEKNFHLLSILEKVKNGNNNILLVGSIATGKTTLVDYFNANNKDAMKMSINDFLALMDDFLSGSEHKGEMELFSSDKTVYKSVILDDLDLFLQNAENDLEKFKTFLSLCEDLNIKIIATSKVENMNIKNEIIASKIMNFERYFLIP